MKIRYTVPSSISRAAYAANGATTSFPAPFKFFVATDLLVILVNDTTAVETIQVLTTNYTVTGGAGADGSVTMLVAPAAGNTLVIERNIPFTQEIDLEPNDPFPAGVTEEGFDRNVMLSQQNRLGLQKTPKLPATYDPATDPEIRLPMPGAGKVLVGNAAETGWDGVTIQNLAVTAIPVVVTGLADRNLLEYDGGSTVWRNQTLATVLGRMLTTAGDIAVNIAGAVSRLAKGTDGQVFTVVAGAPAWATPVVPVGIPTGSRIGFVGLIAPTGWVLASGLTIGSAASGATGRANADTTDLFALLWTSYTNTELVIQTSAGANTTRGASAAADFAANKRMPTPDYSGRVAAGKDNMSGTSRDRLTSPINGDIMGVAGGSQSHTLVAAEVPNLNFTGSGTGTATVPFDNTGVPSADPPPTGGGSPSSSFSAPVSVTVSGSTTTGGGGAHNNLQPTIIETVIIKL